MTEARIERKLAAILAADVAGYSYLIGADEDGTLKALTERRAILDKLIADHRGRIANTAGDSVLAEFGSAIEAVECAIKAQTTLAEANSSLSTDRRVQFRIGIHIGDVVVRGGDLFGDSVNLAARLEGIAEPGGVCISSSTYDQVRGKVGTEFADLGEQNLKNIDHPVRAYALVRDEPSPTRHAERARSDARTAPRLSIVVLPFANLSGDPEQDYFVDGVTESLTTDLSRISGAFVIGRHTAFTYKDKAVDLKRVGRELNIRYVLEGSVQRSGNRLRVSAQLVDAESGNQLWGRRFDKPVANLFDMQDEIVSRLANSLDAELIAAEARRAEHSLHPDATDLVFQGLACFYKGWTPKHLTQGRGFFERAMALDPENISAMLGIAGIHVATSVIFATDDRAMQLAAAEMLSDRALSLAPNHALAHLTLGGVYLQTNRAAQGISECERALALDHNMAFAHGGIAVGKLYLGRAAETEGHVLSALRLSPRDLSVYMWTLFVGLAKVQLGADAEAMDWLRRSIEANRSFPPGHFNLAAVLALLGTLDEARNAAKVGLALNPSFTLRRFRLNASSDNPNYLAGRERLYEGMRLAGVPEG
jgi:TolB-like protein/class 3 adenylate cyclase